MKDERILMEANNYNTPKESKKNNTNPTQPQPNPIPS